MQPQLRRRPRPSLLDLAALSALALWTSCSSGGGGGAPPSSNVGVDPAIGTILSSTAVTPGLGGLLVVDSDDPELDGMSLDVPSFSVTQPLTLSVGPPDELAPTNPLGALPVGSSFVIEPSGTTFAEPATLTLPIPTDHSHFDLHVGRWDPQTSTWEMLGGTVDGDFVSVDVDHLSTYGVFYSGTSLVRVLNATTPAEDIDVRYIAGPVLPNDDQTTNMPAYNPIDPDGIAIPPGDDGFMSLLPGAYHFAVTYGAVANSLYFTIPELASGADDSGVDQTITIDLVGATSDDPTTDASILFDGATQTPGSNLPPVIQLDVDAPSGVPAVDAETGGPITSTTRFVDVGPIDVSQLVPGSNGLQLIGTATDPEAFPQVHVAWTWSWGTLPSHDFPVNGGTLEKTFLPNPRRAGTYTVYYTAYDNLGLFTEGHWNIEVRANTEPTIDVVVDDRIIDFGRLDAIRVAAGSCIPAVPPIPGPGPLCAYVDTDLDFVQDTTVIKTLPPQGPVENPNQDPTSLTCVFAMVFDVDGDELTGGFLLPTPIYGRGTVYAALPVPPAPGIPTGLMSGEWIDTYEKMDAYNEYLMSQANLGFLPPDPVIFPDYPPGTQALPIIWEAPDDPDTPTDSTNDCSEFGDCEIVHGGIVNIVAKVRDPFSREIRNYDSIGFPDDHGVCQIQIVTPNPVDPGPGEGVTVVAKVFPAQPGLSITFAITGSDGYFNTATYVTDEDGCSDFYVPGGAEGVTDTVTVECGESYVEVTYEF